MQTLISPEGLATRIAELGQEIRTELGPEPITVICILKGSVIFTADLVRAIPGDVHLEFLGVSSYEGTQSTGHVRITHDLKGSIQGKNCLIVEDIVDTGLTLHYLLAQLQAREPRMLRVATLLDKPARRTCPVQADFVGFTIADEFVVGFGLDLDERFRNVPYVAIYEPGVDGQ
jgi:hypoxanthine phosphoribosyltransferase